MAQDNEISHEEIQRLVEQRYGSGREYAEAGEGGGGGGAVTQQALLPRASDPRLWVVRCAEGAEREVVTSLLQARAFVLDAFVCVLERGGGAILGIVPSHQAPGGLLQC